MPTRLSEPGKPFGRPRKIKRPKGSHSKYQWETPRREYTEGISNPNSNDPYDIMWPTLNVIAERSGIPYGTVAKRSQDEGWAQERQSNILSIRMERKRARAKLLAEEGRNFDTTVLNIAKLGAGTVLARLSEIARSAQQRAQLQSQMMQLMQSGQPVDLDALKQLPDFDPKEVEQLSNAATKFEELGRRVLGDASVEEDNGFTLEAEHGSPSAIMSTNSEERLTDLLMVLQSTGVYEQVNTAAAKELTAGDDDEDTDDDEAVDGVIDALMVAKDVSGDPGPVVTVPVRRTWT